MSGGFEWLDYATYRKYDLDKYELTLQDGTKYVISQEEGLRSMQDLNGNMLTIDDNGIHHTSGREIIFYRDGEGRITNVIDPEGEDIVYNYNSGGNLTEVTDREENTTEYKYGENGAPEHYLTSIKDPRGITPIRNEYDDDGRLVKHIDAFGNEITYNHDMDNNKEGVTDRLGRETVYEYDDRGNVVKLTDPLGNVTEYTYG